MFDQIYFPEKITPNTTTNTATNTSPKISPQIRPYKFAYFLGGLLLSAHLKRLSDLPYVEFIFSSCQFFEGVFFIVIAFGPGFVNPS